MERLNLQTANMVNENIKRLAELFPSCVTECTDENGHPKKVIDFDALKQELSQDIVEGSEERYLFTWPEKRNAVRLANAPTTDTLRPCREESVDFDRTRNLYIEGDNLQVLKLLRENYLGGIDVIYIDPPYNTGSDLVYNDDFSQSADEYIHNSGQEDEEGYRLVANTENNGRYHTDWLNMIYPRLRVARDLLKDDGVIFISIDDNEVNNLRKICDEVFVESNFLNQFVWVNKPEGRQIIGGGAAGTHEYILAYARNAARINEFALETEWLMNIMPSSYKDIGVELKTDAKGTYITTHELFNGNSRFNEATRPTLVFDIYYRESDADIIIEEVSEEHLHPDYVKIPPHRNADGVHKYHAYRWSREKILKEREDLEFVKSGGEYKIYTKRRDFASTNVRDLITDINTAGGNKDLRDLDLKGFSYPKPLNLLRLLIKMATKGKDGDASIVLDFFSGSGTTAQAVMQLNAEDGGRREFIMVQIPEPTEEGSEAFHAGFKNICEIGKERIRRAGRKILDGQTSADGDTDTGFRVLKLDSSNMEDVYYTPEEFSQQTLFADNIKADRSDEDLLFQTMIELGIELSASVEKLSIAGKTVWSVNGGYLTACFDSDVTETVITEIAARHPQYFVMRDSSLADDNVADNFEQIWQEYSNATVRRIL